MSEFENSGKWSWEIQKEQQAKIDELEKQLIAQGQKFNDLSQKLRDTEYRRDELQKRVDEISGYATELAEYASYAEIIGGVSHNRSAIREYCDKIFAYNRAIDLEEEKALRGETAPVPKWSTFKVVCHRCGHYLNGCHCNHFGDQCPHLNTSMFGDDGLAECFNCKKIINKDREVVRGVDDINLTR